MNKAVVKKFDGSKWAMVEAPISEKETRYTSFSLDSKGTPMVAYQNTFDGQIFMKKFDGTNWVAVGGPVQTTSNDSFIGY